MAQIVSSHLQQGGPTYLSGYQEHTPYVNRETLIYPSVRPPVHSQPPHPWFPFLETWAPRFRKSSRTLLLPKSRPISEETLPVYSNHVSRPHREW